MRNETGLGRWLVGAALRGLAGLNVALWAVPGIGQEASVSATPSISGFTTMLTIEQQPLAYVDALELRANEDIQLVVIHATETPDLGYARELAEVIHYPGSGTGNSGHFYIDLAGQVYQYVPLERVAHHVSGHNKNSIGIELVNRGRFPHWFDSRHQHWQAAYPQAQLTALNDLLAALREHCPNLRQIARHSDLDRRLIPSSDQADVLIARKLDPGPTFPWDWLLEHSALTAVANQVE